MRTNRRNFMKASVGTFAMAGQAVQPASIITLGSDKFTPVASEGAGFNGFAPPDFVETYGDARVGWIITYSDDAFGSLESWIDSDGDRDLVAHHPESNRAVISAPPNHVGVSLLDQLAGNGLQSRDYVERIDADVSASHIEPIQNPIQESEFTEPGTLATLGKGYEVTGLAFDEDTTTLATVRENMGVDRAEVTYDSDTPTVKVEIIDTGVNTANGRVFGSAGEGSPIRIPAAKNFITGDEADISLARVTVVNETDEDFNGAETLNGTDVSGSGDSAVVEYSPGESYSVSSESDWTEGTLTDTVVNDSEDLELDTDGGDYVSSGTYDSHWFDFGEETEFTDNTINETLNGETTTWEYRSSPDGTDEDASAWETDITDVPDDQYLQVRVTLESSDGSSTPEVSDYEVQGDLLTGRYISSTRDLEQVDEAGADVSLTDATADIALEGFDADADEWTTVDSLTADSDGEYDLDGDPDAPYNQWRVNIGLETSATDATAEINSESISTPEDVRNSDSDWTAVEDGNGHGTWCASSIRADPSDSEYRGVAADAKVDLYVAKALDDDGGGSSTSILNAVQWGRENDVDIISMSLGTWKYSEAIADEIEKFLDDGGTAVVAAVGNERQTTRWVSSPADVPGVIGVGATSNEPPEDARPGYFSNVGPDNGVQDLSDGETQGSNPTVGCPGVAIEAMVPRPDGTIIQRTNTGTSMSTPEVVGILALLLTDDPSLRGDSEGVQERLETTAVPTPNAGETEVGHGMPVADRLLAGEEPEETQADSLTSEAETRDAAHRAMSGNRLLRFL